MSLTNQLQTTQKACIRFCIRMEWRSHIGLNYFEKNNWLPVMKIVGHFLVVIGYNNLSSVHMSGLHTLSSSPVVITRQSVNSFVEPIYMKETSRNSNLYLGSKIWNDSDRNIKTSTSTISFTHALKSSSKKTRFFNTIIILLWLWSIEYVLLLFIRNCYGVQFEFCKQQYCHTRKHTWRYKERVNSDKSTININLI